VRGRDRCGFFSLQKPRPKTVPRVFTRHKTMCRFLGDETKLDRDRRMIATWRGGAGREEEVSSVANRSPRDIAYDGRTTNKSGPVPGKPVTDVRARYSRARTDPGRRSRHHRLRYGEEVAAAAAAGRGPCCGSVALTCPYEINLSAGRGGRVRACAYK